MFRPMPVSQNTAVILVVANTKQKEEHSGIALIAGLLPEAWDEDSSSD